MLGEHSGKSYRPATAYVGSARDMSTKIDFVLERGGESTGKADLK
jgi:hypothetical protein